LIPYASNTGTRRNLSALREAGWRILLTPDNPRPPERLQFAIDNGAWGMRNLPLPHDFSSFADLVNRYGCAADFVVLPDLVGGGMDSLSLSISWIPKLRALKNLLLPLQDGMTPEEVGKILREHRNVGLFLGGTTEFKLREIYAWGCVAGTWRRWYHVGRVNTARRIRLCAEAGATSFDGTSATMYSSTVPLLDSARKQPSLLAPSMI
jgi:hypothetical protein